MQAINQHFTVGNPPRARRPLARYIQQAATAATVPNILLQCSISINPRRRKGKPPARRMHQHRTYPTVPSPAPAIESRDRVPPTRSRATREVAARTGARDPAARGAVGAHPTCPKRNRYARVARIPRTAAAAVACAVLPPRRRGGPVEVAGGVSGRFEARVMGGGPGAVAGRSPPAGPAVASVHTFSSGCAAAPSLLEQHKGFQTLNDCQHKRLRAILTKKL